MRGNEMASTFNLNPSTATNQPVNVVPTLAPKIIPNTWLRLISPALTKPSEATVTALDDCTIAVMVKPVSIPLAGVLVQTASRCRKLAPAADFSPSVIIPIARIKRPRPPINPPIEEIVSFICISTAACDCLDIAELPTIRLREIKPCEEDLD